MPAVRLQAACELLRIHLVTGASESDGGVDPSYGLADQPRPRLTPVSEVVAGIDISDATVRTGILEAVAEVLGAVN
ncbi:DUF7902 domain-containing protein, partial [Streptomyces albidoflavus]